MNIQRKGLHNIMGRDGCRVPVRPCCSVCLVCRPSGSQRYCPVMSLLPPGEDITHGIGWVPVCSTATRRVSVELTCGSCRCCQALGGRQRLGDCREAGWVQMVHLDIFTCCAALHASISRDSIFGK